MTKPEPNGMGLPAPDTNAPDTNGDGKPDNDGNGKIDIYILDPNQCRQRQNGCQTIDGLEPASAPSANRATGTPTRITMSRVSRCGAAGTSFSREAGSTTTTLYLLTHEFFHILQKAHDDQARSSSSDDFTHWYSEASATWAQRYYPP